MWYEFNELGDRVLIKHPRQVKSRWGGDEGVPEVLCHPNDNKLLELVKTDSNGTKHYKTTTCYSCTGSGVVVLGSNSERHECKTCNGTGKLKRAKTFKVHTPEYGAVLEKEYMDSRNQTFFDNNGINSDGTTYAYIGDTYTKKDLLKDNGARYSNIMKRWLSKELIEGHAAKLINVPLRVQSDLSIGFDFGYEKVYHEDVRVNTHLDDLMRELKALDREVKAK